MAIPDEVSATEPRSRDERTPGFHGQCDGTKGTKIAEADSRFDK